MTVLERLAKDREKRKGRNPHNVTRTSKPVCPQCERRYGLDGLCPKCKARKP